MVPPAGGAAADTLTVEVAGLTVPGVTATAAPISSGWPLIVAFTVLLPAVVPVKTAV